MPYNGLLRGHLWQLLRAEVDGQLQRGQQQLLGRGRHYYCYYYYNNYYYYYHHYYYYYLYNFYNNNNNNCYYYYCHYYYNQKCPHAGPLPAGGLTRRTLHKSTT